MENQQTSPGKTRCTGSTGAPCYTMYDRIVKRWNNQADSFNQWDNLSTEEQVEFSVKETASRCKEIAQQRYLANNQAVNIDAKISNEFCV